MLGVSILAVSPELLEAAKEEGKVVVYSITSRISNAAEAFTAKYGIAVEAYNLKDFEMIEKVSREVGSGIIGADFVVDSVMEISFSSSNYLLFNKETKEKIGAGPLKLHSKWTTF
jgi:spermidine/putrescine-binding protein